MERKYHFRGYATRDGRTIRKNAFKGCDGIKVPLVWNHIHDDPNAVLGHAILENREDGVYAYCTFNDEPQGRNALGLVKHGDVRSLSIWANQLKQIGGDVIHGVIRELSLVLAGANPGAYIDFVMAHSAESSDELYANYDENALVLHHSVDEDDDEGDKTEVTSTEVSADESANEVVEEKPENTEDETLQHSEEKSEETDEKSKDKTVKDVFDTLNEEQKNLLYGLIGGLVSNDNSDDDAESDDSMPQPENDGKTVKEVVDQLISQGYVSGRPSLGLTGEWVSEFNQQFRRLPAGLYITKAVDDSVIQETDIVLSVDGVRVTKEEELTSVLYAHQVGDTVSVVFYRSGRQYSTEVVLQEAGRE